MSVIKFGTDGWRAIIAQEYTVANVERISEATAQWMLKKKMTKVVIGYDCRFGGRMFSEVSATVFGNYGIKVFLSPDFVSTPMVSLGVVKTGSDLGVVITASHNPPSYNGYKLKSSYGGPTIPSDIEEVESLVPETSLSNLPSISELREKGLLDYLDLEQMYIEHVKANFDLDKIKSSGLKLAYDGMYGAGQNVIRKLFPDALLLHCDFNPSFMGQAPEPIEKNLKEIAGIIANNDYNLGLANDGDADRIGLFDEDGRFVDSHHILLLLLYYMFEYKKMTGKVVITFSVTDKMKKLAELYGLQCEVTKIGFKYIAEIMTNEDVLVGGEESGGLAVKDDHHITNAIKDEVMRKCKDGEVKMLGSRPVVRTETIDGYKFYLNDDEWIMVRASGTEPVLRIYAQTPTTAQSRTLLEEAAKSLMG